MSDFAEALANPIKYQSELEKRAEQLAVLMEEITPSEDDATSSCESIFCNKSSYLSLISSFVQENHYLSTETVHFHIILVFISFYFFFIFHK